jgi:circadian clock protein KaiB
MPAPKTHKKQTKAGTEGQEYVFCLYISGMTARSREAIVNFKKIGESYLNGRYQLEVIDLYQQPELAAKHQILATPTLVKSLPLPPCRFIGTLSETKETVRRLGLSTNSGEP